MKPAKKLQVKMNCGDALFVKYAITDLTIRMENEAKSVTDEVCLYMLYTLKKVILDACGKQAIDRDKAEFDMGKEVKFSINPFQAKIYFYLYSKGQIGNVYSKADIKKYQRANRVFFEMIGEFSKQKVHFYP